MASGVPKLYRALYDYDSNNEGDLRFRANDIIAVSDTGESKDSWWAGECHGRSGLFPGTFVTELKSVTKTFTAPEDTRADAPGLDQSTLEAEAEAIRRAQEEARVTAEWEARLTQSFAPAEKKVRFPNILYTEIEVYSRFEYDRRGDFDPEAARREWEGEEEEERMRQLEDRWLVFERSLPPGTKCDERIQFEKLRAELERRKQEAEEQARRTREEKRRKLAEARAAREAAKAGGSAQPVAPAAAPASTPATAPSAQQLTGMSTESEGRAERLRRLKEERARKAAADRGQAPVPAAAKAPAASTGGAEPSRAERLRALKEARDAKARAEARGAAPAPSVSGRGPSSYMDETPSSPFATNSLSNAAQPNAEDLAQVAEANASPRSSVVLNEAPTMRGSGSSSNDMAAIDNAIEVLEQRIKEMSVPDAQGQDGFTRDFYMLDDQDSEIYDPSKCVAATEHPELNRYQDILPYDSARVVLNKELSGNPDDYINASYVRNLLPGSPEYIAAQGPTEATTAHFWKMVAQERGRVVVMVTRLVENNRSKCHQYWPDAGQSAVFPASHAGPEVRVTAIAERTQPCWTEREFEVRDQGPDGEARTLKVVQMHFTDWPDHGVPDSAASFLSFLHAVMSAQRIAKKDAQNAGRRAPPLVLHCSAGVGRTGVFCTVYSALSALPYLSRGTLKELNVLDIVQRMRQSRRYMVQTQQQYKFCYQAILHATRLYRDGCKVRERLTQRHNRSTSSDSISSASSAPDKDPVWLHTDVSRDDAMRLLLPPKAQPVEGKFLVRRTAGSQDKFHLSHVCDGKFSNHLISRSSANEPFTVDLNPCGRCMSLVELVDFMRVASDEWPHKLTTFVPNPHAAAEEIQVETKYAEAVANKSGSLTGRRGGVRSRVLGEETVRHFSGDSGRSRTSFSGQAADSMVGDSIKPGGELLVASGREQYLTFLNGEYIELSTPQHGRPAFRRRERISQDYAQLAGQHVFLYYDGNSAAWILYIIGLGALAAAPGDHSHPADIESTWTVLEQMRASEFVPDPKFRVRRSKGGQDGSMGKDEYKRMIAEQLAESQAREERLARQLSQLQGALGDGSDGNSSGGGDSSSSSSSAALQARARQLEERCSALETELARAHDLAEQRQRKVDKLEKKEALFAAKTKALEARIANLEKQNLMLKGRVGELQDARDSSGDEDGAGDAEGEAETQQQQQQQSAEDAAALQRLRSEAMASANLFAKEMGIKTEASAAPPKRGLPTGVVWGENEEEEEEDEADGDNDEEEYVALRPYEAMQPGELSFNTGDTIIVLDDSDAKWWEGRHAHSGRAGRFPAAFVGTKM